MVGDVAKSLGVEPTQLRLVDGSGVSRQNLVTPRAVLQLLQAKRDDDEWHEFLTVRASCGAKKEKVA
jgi:D-alanyl-D-alanine carboxypeptidase